MQLLSELYRSVETFYSLLSLSVGDHYSSQLHFVSSEVFTYLRLTYGLDIVVHQAPHDCLHQLNDELPFD